MWTIVRRFVSTVLQSQYPGGDADVAADPLLVSLCEQMQIGELKSFPRSIEKFEDLVDIVTNIIHIAATQHTTVNYLQQYYMTFVPNLPGALYSPLPTSLEELGNVKEQKLLDSLPIRFEREWLLMGQVPYLLSFAAPQERSIFQYATDASGSTTVPVPIRDAARILVGDLDKFSERVQEISKAMEDQQTPYVVMDPRALTSSIIL